MVAIIGGDPRRFRPLVDLYREAGRQSGHAPEQLKVGVHALGYVGSSAREAVEAFYPGYAEGMTRAGRERGWGPVTRAHFDAEVGRHGALIVGGPEEVLDKIHLYDDALGGISRLTFQMDMAALPHTTLLRSIDLLGTRVAPALQSRTAAAA
jgi:alkanesulfonate monooxygenase SsuD/methylene tetrahydromethanopterin reductase-like flavin-dependent oxidoreductase (luciferase family)